MQGVHSESLEQSQFAAADGDAHDRSEPVTAVRGCAPNARPISVITVESRM